MALPKQSLILLLVYFANVESASFFDHPIEYVMNLGRNVAPNFSALLDCLDNKDVWVCAKTVAGKMLDGYDEDVEQQRRMWKESADAEVRQSGRQFEEAPSKLGADIESSLFTLTDVLQQSIARSFSPKKHGGGGIDTITVTTGQGHKKDKKKKKKQPHVHVMQMPMQKMEEKGPFQSWVLGHGTHEKDLKNPDLGLSSQAGQGFKASEALRPSLKASEALSFRPIQVTEGLSLGNGSPRDKRDVNEGHEVGISRGFFQDAWSLGEKSVDSIAEHVMKSEEADSEIVDKSSLDEQRGKKKKKKKAILKLLLLGAVLKAKIGTMLQILSFKLQVKFLLIAIAGLLINLARFWIDVKKQGHQAPQKVIYYEHAQHQHHYDHEEEPGWSSGPWSRSYDEGETGPEPDMVNNSPYRGQEKIPLEFIRPVPSRI